MSVKDATAGGATSGGMVLLLGRLLAILALVLMPVTMTVTPAAAGEPGQTQASMPCDDHHKQPSKSAPDLQVHCTSCVAIAQPSFATPDALLEPVAILTDRDQRLLLGILLEVATPPPRAI